MQVEAAQRRGRAEGMSAPTRQAPDDAMATPPERRRHPPKRGRRVITAAEVIVAVAAAGAGYYEIIHLPGNAPAPAVNTDSTAPSIATWLSLSMPQTLAPT